MENDIFSMENDTLPLTLCWTPTVTEIRAAEELRVAAKAEAVARGAAVMSLTNARVRLRLHVLSLDATRTITFE